MYCLENIQCQKVKESLMHISRGRQYLAADNSLATQRWQLVSFGSCKVIVERYLCTHNYTFHHQAQRFWFTVCQHFHYTLPFFKGQ